MDPTVERAQMSPFLSDPDPGQAAARTVPILQTPIVQTSSPSPRDPMEITTTTMGPPARAGEDNEANGTHEHLGGVRDQQSTGSMASPNAAAAAAAGGGQQPKVVQTAFIHKLYK